MCVCVVMANFIHVCTSRYSGHDANAHANAFYPLMFLQIFGKEVTQQLLALHAQSPHLLLSLEMWVPLPLAGKRRRMYMHTYAHICTHMHTYAHICTHMHTSHP